MSKRRKLCLATIIAETAGPDHKLRTSAFVLGRLLRGMGSAPVPQRCRRDGPPDGIRPAPDPESGGSRIGAAAYAAQMITIEGQRNAACRQGDVETLRLLAERSAWLNYRFWGRTLN